MLPQTRPPRRAPRHRVPAEAPGQERMRAAPCLALWAGFALAFWLGLWGLAS